MKLTDLRPRFKQYMLGIADKSHGRVLPDGTTQWGGFEVDTLHPVESLAAAHGIWFDCPKCSPQNPHGVLVWFAGSPVPAHMGLNSQGETVRWNLDVNSRDFTDLTLTPSILLIGGCGWHGFVTNGQIITC